jgi:enoyl-CoA hydratase/carnithine racemase/carbon monoxide dehydrogenase subunit G
MEMVGEARIAAPRDVVWRALNDPEVLQSSIPGCEELQRTADNEFSAKVVSKVGPIKARFAGKVTLSNIDAPRSYTLTGEGHGGAAGFVRSDIDVSLEAPEPAVTVLRYGVKANIGGKLAQLGSRMVDAAARKAADEFFAQFGSVVARKAESAPDQAVAATAPSWIEAATAPPAIEDSQVRLRPVRSTPSAGTAIPPAANDAEWQKALMQVWTTEQIKVWISDQIAVVTLNRPQQRNAMTYAMWRAMPGLMSALERNPEVGSIILTGAGSDFCSGADIPEFEHVRADTEQATAYEVAVDACCDAIAGTSKPTIAVVNGYCLGGGAHLAMSCDFRYASPEAKFGIPAARLSIIYGVRGTQKLLSLVGLSRAKRILFGGERFDAQEALRIGFVDHVAGGDTRPRGWLGRVFGAAAAAQSVDPMPPARAFARQMAGNAPLSIAGAKYILNGVVKGTGALDLDHAEELIARAAGSADYKEGRAAFAERRAPRFKGA